MLCSYVSDVIINIIQNHCFQVVHTHQKLFVITIPSMFASLVLLHSDQGAQSIPVDQLLKETAKLAEAVIFRGHTVDLHLLDNKGATGTITTPTGI